MISVGTSSIPLPPQGVAFYSQRRKGRKEYAKSFFELKNRLAGFLGALPVFAVLTPMGEEDNPKAESGFRDPKKDRSRCSAPPSRVR